MQKKSSKKEKKAMTFSLYGNLFFVILEIVMAIWTHSQAVLLDAVYDGLEFIMLLPSVFLIPLLYKPSTEKLPFGYMQVESMFVVVKGIAMTAVTVGLIASNISLLLHGGHIVAFSQVAWFELLASALGIIMTIYLTAKNSTVNSPLIDMEMKSWKTDSILSLGMAIAFFLPSIITAEGFQRIVPYLDQIITIVLSLIVIPVPLKAVITGFRDLFLIPPEEEIIDEIKGTIEPILSRYGFDKTYYEIVRTGRKLWIKTFIAFEKDTLYLSKFKKIQDECIEALSKEYDNFQFELFPDLEFSIIPAQA